MFQPFLYLIYFLVAVFLLYVSGKFWMNFFRRSAGTYFDLVTNLLVGITAAVVIVSVCRSGFLTINTFIFPLVISLFIARRKQLKNPFKGFSLCAFELKNILLIPPVFFTVFLFLIYDLSAQQFHVAHLDHLVYSQLSTIIYDTGVESKDLFLNYFDVEGTKPRPYHYFELWMNAAFSKAFGSSAILTLFLNTYPILLFTFYLGLVAIAERFITGTFAKIFIPFVLLLVSGMHFQFFDKFEILNWQTISYSSHLHPFGFKLLPLCAFYVMGINLFLRDRKLETLLLLLAVPLLNITTLPGVVASVALVSVFYFFKPAHRKKTLVISGSIVILLLFFIMFYSGGSNFSKNVSTASNLALLVQNPTDVTVYKSIFWKAIIPLIRTVVYYIPFTILLGIAGWFSSEKFKSINWNLLLGGLLIVFSSLFISAFFSNVTDGVQIFTNQLALLNVLSIYLILALWQVLVKRKFLLVALMLLLISNLLYFKNAYGKLFGPKYSIGYEETVLEKLKGKKFGGQMFSEKRYRNQILPVTTFELPGNLVYFDNEFKYLTPLNLDVFDTSSFQNEQWKLYEQFPVVKQKVDLKQAGEIDPQTDFLRVFIEKNNIEFIFYSGSDTIESRIMDLATEIIVDSKSQEKVVILNPAK